jgi:hypothetical protein
LIAQFTAIAEEFFLEFRSLIDCVEEVITQPANEGCTGRLEMEKRMVLSPILLNIGFRQLTDIPR